MGYFVPLQSSAAFDLSCQLLSLFLSIFVYIFLLTHWPIFSPKQGEVEKKAVQVEEQDAQRLVKATSEQWLQEWVKDGTRTDAKKASTNRHFVPPSAAPSTLMSVAPL